METGAIIGIAIGSVCFFLLIICLIRRWANGPSNTHRPSLAGKVIVITGANTGIGYYSALEMAKLGPKAIVLACRSEQRGNDAVKRISQDPRVNLNCVEYMNLDLGDLNSVKAFAAEVTAKYP
jgi:NAD(P)-dependent dehydrogenase (short-subunit alcohol dehydrogenase family)